jgi:hypothetical protein
MAELNRVPDDEGRRHLANSQFFVVAVLKREIGLHLAGKRACGEVNRFAYKHLLDTSGKAGVNAEEKARRRLMHRTFPTGNIPGTELQKWRGQKDVVKGSLSHAQKYGDPLMAQVNKGKAKLPNLVERYDVTNTVIDLSAITLAEVLERIAVAFWNANIGEPAGGKPASAKSAVVEVDFHAQRVLTTKMYFNVTSQTWGANHKREQKVSLVGARPYARLFEIYHLGKKIP